MRTVAKYDELRVPTWALPMLVNGDADGLTDAEIEQVQNWFNEYTATATKWPRSSVVFNAGNDEGYFTSRPEFGLACNVVDCEVVILIPDEVRFIGISGNPASDYRKSTLAIGSGYLKAIGNLPHGHQFRPTKIEDRDALVSWLQELRFDDTPPGV